MEANWRNAEASCARICNTSELFIKLQLVQGLPLRINLHRRRSQLTNTSVMSPSTLLIVCVFYLFAIACYAEESALEKLDKLIPQCRELGSKAFAKSVKKLLYIDVLNSKRQDHGPTYTCDLEKLAYELVETTDTEPVSHLGKEVILDQGENLNLNKLRNEWGEKLKVMENKERFGCNLNLNHKTKK
ncbi:hypothetical protein Y032_0020g40 [Ancylostoma ceylanicum]|uniref:Uncharacterized protein n=1 Tax=Ancylostoma ceylanicum TaxID=53326 RepID=A0A016V165_9BILA|nr:hypothetical protein Y032_0020g40 [Ancylostoma ceylanicum]